MSAITLSASGPSIFKIKAGSSVVGQIGYSEFEIAGRTVAVAHITIAKSYRGYGYSKHALCALATATKLPVWSADRAKAAGAAIRSGTVGLGRALWDSLNRNGMPGYVIQDDEIMEAS